MIVSVPCKGCGEPVVYTQTSPLPEGMGIYHGACWEKR